MLTTAKKYTSRDYEQLAEGAPYQLIDGELVMTPSPNFEHQDILLNLAVQLRSFVVQQKFGTVVIAPMDVQLTDTEVYQPDIIYVSDKRKGIIQERIKGTPDLIIEVLSPSNAYYDLVHKKNVYEATGVREYWIVDPQEKSIEVYENVDRQFRLHGKAKQTGMVGSKLLEGFSVNLDELFDLQARLSPQGT